MPAVSSWTTPAHPAKRTGTRFLALLQVSRSIDGKSSESKCCKSRNCCVENVFQTLRDSGLYLTTFRSDDITLAGVERSRGPAFRHRGARPFQSCNYDSNAIFQYSLSLFETKIPEMLNVIRATLRGKSPQEQREQRLMPPQKAG